jgi:hypothetical protein
MARGPASATAPRLDYSTSKPLVGHWPIHRALIGNYFLA